MAFVIRHAKRMGGVILSSVASSHIFPHYLLNGTIFGGGLIEHKMRNLMFFLTVHHSIDLFQVTNLMYTSFFL